MVINTDRTRVADLANRSPRLLIWTDSLALGGVSEFNHSLAVGLASRGYDIIFVGPEFDPQKSEQQRLLGIRHYEVMLPEHRIRGYDITTPGSTTALVREIAPDIVLFSDGSAISNLVAKAAITNLGLPMLFSIGIVLEQHVSRARVNPNFSTVYGAAREVICVSQHNRQLLKQAYPIGNIEPRLIHYGRPPVFFEPPNRQRRETLRAELGVAPQEVLFLTNARYDPIKGFGLFVLALKVLRGTPIWTQLKFAWAGEGPAQSQIHSLLVSEGLIERVRLLGPRSDVADLLNAADVFVLPSYAEGMPLSVMEAMAKGLPVIASSVGGIPEELGQAGVLIPSPSVSASDMGTRLVQVITDLAAQQSRRVALGRRARSRAELLFREERMVTDYWRLISDATPHEVPRPHDYVSKGMQSICLDTSFPNMIKGNTGECDWPYLRREIPHLWYVDRRYPDVGFLSRDEAHIVFNTARLFAGKPALEIGCFMGWSTCHLASGGVQLDVVDPLLANPVFRTSVEASLRASGIATRVNLVSGKSPSAVRGLARDGRRWSLIFIDGDHEGDAPRIDAETIEQFAARDCVVLFHDLAATPVAQGLRYLRDRGWQVRIYRTMQIMAAAWRGDIEPPAHVPDGEIALPLNIADIVEHNGFPTIHRHVKPYTMTSVARQFALHQAINFIVDNQVVGNIVECGVWRGGSMMVAALTLLSKGIKDRSLELYDTFSGMTPPTDEDVEATSGRPARTILDQMPRSRENFYWAIAPLGDVMNNLKATGYPEKLIDCVAGDVCQTLASRPPQAIALLRLDTDWYASTRCELESLYEQLSPGGILIVDDYGHWEGARQACDEFFSERGVKLYPVPDDDTGYWMVKGSREMSEQFLRSLRL